MHLHEIGLRASAFRSGRTAVANDSPQPCQALPFGPRRPAAAAVGVAAVVVQASDVLAHAEAACACQSQAEAAGRPGAAQGAPSQGAAAAVVEPTRRHR